MSGKIIKPYTSCSLVEEMIMNPSYLELARVWRRYRVEYYYPGSPYSEHECGIYLPRTFDAWELEKQINQQLKDSQNEEGG